MATESEYPSFLVWVCCDVFSGALRFLSYFLSQLLCISQQSQTFCYKRFVHCFGLCIVKIISLLLSPKNVIEAVRGEGNLYQIESLLRKMTIIGHGHVGIWARHSRDRPSEIWALCRIMAIVDMYTGLVSLKTTATSWRTLWNCRHDLRKQWKFSGWCHIS